jgi:class 3 adenylate cyclase/tetratricopeptide (TPR) repeat protein
MKCPVCQHESRDPSEICLNCGRQLPRICTTCGAQPPGESNFCPQCGTVLRDIHMPRPLGKKPLDSTSPLKDERKEVTVLFADLKGSMDLLAHRDPEEARELLDPVLEQMMEAVHRYEGTVNQVMGDGIMALFGAPIAYEDHAVRACHAALRMQESFARQSEHMLRSRGMPIQIRVGVNSGEVVVRSVGSDVRMDYTAVGQATHVAARIEQLANPGSILITGETMKLAEGHVDVKLIGPVTVKGLDTPVEVYELVGTRVLRSRLEAAAAQSLTRFVGRDAELEQLRHALDRALTGEGQTIGVVGEPGVGKSRLFYEFVRQPWTQAWLVLATSAVSYEKNIPYPPVINLLQTYFKVEGRDAPATIREKVLGKLLSLSDDVVPLLPPLLALLGAPVDDPAWRELDPPQRRERILHALKSLFLTESCVQPVCIVLENLHWIDSETEAFLAGLVTGLAAHRVLLLVNYRPEYRPFWGIKPSSTTELRIDPLPPGLAGELLKALLGGDPALGPLKQLLISQTNGNPFFLEETVRSLVETEALVGGPGAYRLARPVAKLHVPATVKAVLASRIDRLPFDEERLLQSAAVIGSHVDIALLRAISGVPEEQFLGGLAHLQELDFLYVSRPFPDEEYTFKHALTHEVAYSSLLHDRQRALHARIVNAIEELYPDRLIEQTERLAHHAFRGEVAAKAVEYLLRSGRRALFASATVEAVEAFEHALLALRRLPQTPDTLHTAIGLRLNLRDALWSVGRVAKIREQLVEAEAIAHQLGDKRSLAAVACYLCHYLWAIGELEAALEAGQRALTIGPDIGDPLLIAETELYRSIVVLAQGDGAHATRVLQRTLREVDRLQPGKRGQANRATAIRLLVRSFLMRSLAELGRFEEGVAYGEEALRLAEPNGTPFGRVTALAGLGSLYLRKGDHQAAIPLLERGLELCRTYPVNNWLPTVGASLGAAYAATGRVDEGIALLEQAVELDRRMGIVATLSLWRVYLGDAYFRAGRVAEALGEARRALGECRSRGERGYEAWGLHLVGRIVASQSPPDDAESQRHFLMALELAEQLGMRPLVVRCLLDLTRFHARLGNVTAAEQHRERAVGLAAELRMSVTDLDVV